MTTTEEASRQQGQVKFFNIQKGFGFVKSLSGDGEYFVHVTDLMPKSNCFVALYSGEYIEFTLEKCDKGFQCRNVTGINNGPLLCEFNYHVQRKRRTDGGKRHKEQKTDNSEADS